MDGASLAQVMGNTVSRARYDELAGPCSEAMLQAGVTTPLRAAMWCAQLGHESVGLKYFQELGGAAYFRRYDGRRDLGNVFPGDGARFHGRGPIQLTGRLNYGRFGAWCHLRGLVPSSSHFQHHPDLVATPRWGFMAAAWYWAVARPQLNRLADAGDLVACTRAINGGTNGLADRRRRYSIARTMGARLLPSEEDDMFTDADRQMLQDLRARVCAPHPPWGGGVSNVEPGGTTPAESYDLLQFTQRNNVEVHQALRILRETKWTQLSDADVERVARRVAELLKAPQ